jgi:hypothetical protein
MPVEKLARPAEIVVALASKIVLVVAGVEMQLHKLMVTAVERFGATMNNCEDLNGVTLVQVHECSSNQMKIPGQYEIAKVVEVLEVWPLKAEGMKLKVSSVCQVELPAAHAQFFSSKQKTSRFLVNRTLIH